MNVYWLLINNNFNGRIWFGFRRYWDEKVLSIYSKNGKYRKRNWLGKSLNLNTSFSPYKSLKMKVYTMVQSKYLNMQRRPVTRLRSSDTPKVVPRQVDDFITMNHFVDLEWYAIPSIIHHILKQDIDTLWNIPWRDIVPDELQTELETKAVRANVADILHLDDYNRTWLNFRVIWPTSLRVPEWYKRDWFKLITSRPIEGMRWKFNFKNPRIR